MRHQLHFAQRLQAGKGFQNRIKFGQNILIVKNIRELPDYELFKSFVIENESIEQYRYVFSSAMINGITYKKNMLLITGETHGSAVWKN